MAREGIKIKHNRKLFFTIIILFILVIFLFVIIKIKEGQEKLGECKIDADCVKQQVTCCNCNMGGIEECVSKKNATHWQEKLGECEKNIMCIALYNCKDTSCKCEENKCIER